MRYVYGVKKIKKLKNRFINLSTATVLALTSIAGAAPLFLSSSALAATLNVCPSGCTYTTIQSAVNTAAPGDTISVAAGTYNENISVNKALTIDGAQAGNDARSRTTGNESTVSSISITSSDVTVDGFSFDNTGGQASVTSPTTLSGIVFQNDIFSGYKSVGMPTNNAGNILIQKNLFENAASSSEAIQIKANSDPGGCDGSQVLNNDFVKATNNGGSEVNFSCTGSASSNVTVSGNTTSGISGGSSFVGFSGVDDGIKVTNNSGSTDGSSIFFFGDVSGSALIDGNTFTSGGSSAVSIHKGSDVGTSDAANIGTFTITNNDFSGNVRGIAVSSTALGASGTVVANDNNLSGNSTAGIDNESSTLIDGTNNFWGDASGPSDSTSTDNSVPATNAGSGSQAIGAVTYSPWCTNAACTTFGPDTTKPTVMISSPTANQALNGRTITIKGTVYDDNFNYYYCYVTDAHGEIGTRDAHCNTTWAAGTPFQTTTSGNATGTNNGTLGSVTLPNSQADGPYTVHVVAKDKAGNTTEATQSFFLDNTKPTAKFTSATADPTPNGYYNGNFDVGYEVSDNNALNYVNVSLFDTNSSHTNHYAAGCYSNNSETTNDDKGTCTVHLPANLPDGKYYVQVGGQDTALNYTVNAIRYITIDRTAPTAVITNASQSALNTVSFSGNVNDTNLNYYYCYLTTNQPVTVNGKTFTPGQEVGTRDANCQTTFAKGQTSFTGNLGSFDVTSLPSGNYTVNLVAYDLAGNNNANAPATFTVTIDHTAPTLVVTNPANNTTVNASGDYTTSGTASDAASGLNRVALQINDVTNGGTSVANIKTRSFGAGGSWSIVIPAGTLVNGRSYTLSFTVYDNAGNHTVVRRTVTIDNTAPVVAVDTLTTTDHTPKLTGTVDDPTATVSVVVDGQTYSTTINGNTWSAQVTNRLKAGTYDVAATATDPAGNVGHDSTTNELTVNKSTSGGSTTTTTGGNTSQTTNTNNVVVTNFSSQNARSGNANGNNANSGSATNGNATDTSAVLGDSTTTPSSDTGNVKGDSTVKTVQNDSNFLGLGWYWLIVLAAIIGFLYALLRRRSSDANA